MLNSSCSPSWSEPTHSWKQRSVRQVGLSSTPLFLGAACGVGPGRDYNKSTCSSCRPLCCLARGARLGCSSPVRHPAAGAKLDWSSPVHHVAVEARCGDPGQVRPPSFSPQGHRGVLPKTWKSLVTSPAYFKFIKKPWYRLECCSSTLVEDHWERWR